MSLPTWANSAAAFRSISIASTWASLLLELLELLEDELLLEEELEELELELLLDDDELED